MLSDELTNEERRKLQGRLVASPVYRIAFEDEEFMNSEELRPVRLQLELLKPERELRKEDVHSTVVVFGSARIVSPDLALLDVEIAEEKLKRNPDDPMAIRDYTKARKRVEYSHYYNEARRFAVMMSRRHQHDGPCHFVVVTGGGPGIMEAGNRGAFDVGAKSIGLNITLPHEQEPNPYISPELCFHFHYFALRKMHFMMRARALVAFPGGYGTMDELFEALTLVQTGKMPRMPIILVGRDFWAKAINLDFLVEEGMINPEDKQLVDVVDSAEEIIEILERFYPDCDECRLPAAGSGHGHR